MRIQTVRDLEGAWVDKDEALTTERAYMFVGRGSDL